MFRKNKKTAIAIQRHNPLPDIGLSRDAVLERINQNLINQAKIKSGKSYRKIFFSNIFTFFNLIWAIIAAILIWVGETNDLFFLLIISANIFIGIVQEIKAKRTVEKLTLMNAPQTIVVRDGKKQTIKTSEIVLDDVIVLSSGNQVGADSIILTGSVEVNESLLTGESVPVKKTVGDILFAASFITSSTCCARADKIGIDSYVQQLAKQAKGVKEPVSQLLRSLKLIINVIGIMLIPLSALVFYRNQAILGGIHDHDNLVVAITKSAGAIIGMIPSGMFLLTSVALAVGVVNLAKKRTLVRDMYSIEMLARATVLCLDKTGTITDGTMNVHSLVPLGKQKYPPQDIISSHLYATEDNNQTARALIDEYGCTAIHKSVKKLAFSSARKFSAVTLEKAGTYALGAPEFILTNTPSELQDQIDSYAKQGLRVILCAHSKKTLGDEGLPADMSPAFLVIIEDNIRSDAPETIQWFNDNNVKIKIISGDNPITVAEVARRAGVKGHESLINLEGLSDREVYDAATKFTVFGRVSPEQKAIIVKALKNAGETVAMTGDGVNDILSFKESDCSIAMATGSEATRNIANLVLLNSNFSAMPLIVAEGRRVINNIEKTSSLFLMKTLFVLMLVPLLSAIPIAQLPYPFNPRQMLILEVFVIGMPSFFLALQPNKNLIQGKFIHTIFKKAFPPALLMVINVLAIYILEQPLRQLLDIPTIDISTPAGIYYYEQIVTLCIIITTFIGYAMLFSVCLPFTKYKFWLFIVMAGLGIFVMMMFPGYLKLRQVSLETVAIVAAMMIIDIPLFILFKRLINKIALAIRPRQAPNKAV